MNKKNLLILVRILVVLIIVVVLALLILWNLLGKIMCEDDQFVKYPGNVKLMEQSK